MAGVPSGHPRTPSCVEGSTETGPCLTHSVVSSCQTKPTVSRRSPHPGPPVWPRHRGDRGSGAGSSVATEQPCPGPHGWGLIAHPCEPGRPPSPQIQFPRLEWGRRGTARGDVLLARGAGSASRVPGRLPQGWAGGARGPVPLLCFLPRPEAFAAGRTSGSRNVALNEQAPGNRGENLAFSARRELRLRGRREAADQARTVLCAGPAKRRRWGTPGPAPAAGKPGSRHAPVLAVERSPGGDAECGAGSGETMSPQHQPRRGRSRRQGDSLDPRSRSIYKPGKAQGSSLPIRFSKYCVKIGCVLVTVFWHSLDVVPKAGPRSPRPHSGRCRPPATHRRRFTHRGQARPCSCQRRPGHMSPRPSEPSPRLRTALYTAARSTLTATVPTTEEDTEPLRVSPSSERSGGDGPALIPGQLGVQDGWCGWWPPVYLPPQAGGCGLPMVAWLKEPWKAMGQGASDAARGSMG